MSHRAFKHQGQRYVLLSSTCGILLMFSNVQADVSQSQLDKITADWTCKWCPYKKDAYKISEVEAGVGVTSNDSFKYGNYTGLDQRGGYLIGSGYHESKDSNSHYIRIEVRDLGLDSRQVKVDGGLQGYYDLQLQYSMLPSLHLDTARTPYRGGVNQSLPVGWIQGVNTAAMTELSNSLRDVDIYSERQTIDVGASYYASQSLSYELNFEQQTKQGKKSMGLALLNNSAILAVPINITTKQGGAKVNIRTDRWLASLGYGFSIFSNVHDRVQWGNAYSSPASVIEGQAALEPENEMQRITVDGAYQVSKDTRAMIAVALGQMTQNANFLPYTINGSLSPPPLPRSSLDGKVNTINSVLRLNSRWNEDWNYSVRYRHNEQDNDTPRASYNYVLTDFALTATPRANFPFGFRETELSLQGRYQIDTQRNIKLDYEHTVIDRKYQEVVSSDEDIFSAMYRSEVNEQIQWFLRLKASNRKGDYRPVAEISPPEDTLLRKYNLANRKRNSAGVSLSYTLSNALQLSAFGDYANDDYSKSDIGLQESRQSTYSLELQYRINAALNTNFDYSTTSINSGQVGTSWSAKNKDRMNVIHGGVNYKLKKYKLVLGADITFANAKGDISVSTSDGFPSLRSTRKTFRLFADYSLKDHSVIHAFFAYEDYEELNWGIDGVVPNTLDNVLTLGEVNPSYDIGMFVISYKTQF